MKEETREKEKDKENAEQEVQKEGEGEENESESSKKKRKGGDGEEEVKEGQAKQDEVKKEQGACGGVSPPLQAAYGMSLQEAADASWDLYQLAVASLHSHDYFIMHEEDVRRSQDGLGTSS